MRPNARGHIANAQHLVAFSSPADFRAGFAVVAT
jgi:hypothetical protein